MFYILSGRYRLTELELEIRLGEVAGEIGMVAPDNSQPGASGSSARDRQKAGPYGCRRGSVQGEPRSGPEPDRSAAVGDRPEHDPQGRSRRKAVPAPPALPLSCQSLRSSLKTTESRFAANHKADFLNSIDPKRASAARYKHSAHLS